MLHWIYYKNFNINLTDMTKYEVKKKCIEYGKSWDEFKGFINGQTIGLDCLNCSDRPGVVVPHAKYICPDCGGLDWQANYYKRDVARFLRINESDL